MRPLSNIEIIKKMERLGKPCKCIQYCYMHKFSDLNELLPRTLILYQYQGMGVGHFCCVFKNSEGVNFFDPIGLSVDAGLSSMDDYIKQEFTHDYPYLTKLFYDYGCGEYNEHKLQKIGTNACGYWCFVRMLFEDLTTDEFYDSFRKEENRDEAVEKLYNYYK